MVQDGNKNPAGRAGKTGIMPAKSLKQRPSNGRLQAYFYSPPTIIITPKKVNGITE
jgi:hypothetical protein